MSSNKMKELVYLLSEKYLCVKCIEKKEFSILQVWALNDLQDIKRDINKLFE